MSTPKDGGPAFPTSATDASHFLPDGSRIDVECEGQKSGMSLRDWFAGQALSGICSGFDDLGHATWTWDAAAVSAYSMADAMLAAREKGPQ